MDEDPHQKTPNLLLARAVSCDPVLHIISNQDAALSSHSADEIPSPPDTPPLTASSAILTSIQDNSIASADVVRTIDERAGGPLPLDLLEGASPQAPIIAPELEAQKRIAAELDADFTDDSRVNRCDVLQKRNDFGLNLQNAEFTLSHAVKLVRIVDVLDIR